MDSKLRKILTECIRDIETGARDAESCLRRYPDRAAELRPHLELWSGLNAAAKAQPNYGSQQRGKHQLLGALADMERGTDRGQMIPAVARVAVVMAAAALLIGGAAGASAALGGPDVSGHVLSTMGINHAPEAAQTGKDNANDNAKEGSGNAGQGFNNASQTGQNNANPKTSEGANNAGQGFNNASQTGQNNANPNASEGANNALHDNEEGDDDGDDIDEGDDDGDDIDEDDDDGDDIDEDDDGGDDIDEDDAPQASD
jgi:hypothetical protein